MSAPSIVAAVILRKEKIAIAAFRQAGAVSPERAVTLAEIGADEGIAFRRLRARAVLREAGEGTGRYYFDEPTWIAMRGLRRRLLSVIVAIILIVLFGAIASRAF